MQDGWQETLGLKRLGQRLVADQEQPPAVAHAQHPPGVPGERLYRLLAVVAGIVVAISTILKELLEIPFPPLSWIVGNSLLGAVLLALGGLAVLVTVLGILQRPLLAWLRIAALVVLYAVLVVVVARVLFWPAPSASITAPQTGAEVTQMHIVEGTSVGPVEGKLWIVVRVASPNPGGPTGYFPQEGPVPIEQDRRWKAQIIVGDPNSPGESFLVLAVLADTSSAQAELQAFTASCRSTGCPPALIELPSDVRVLDQIEVTRA